MSTAYDFNDNMLDFEDTDLFLTAILSSVPAMDKMANPYDMDQPGLGGFAFDGSGYVLNNSLDINDPESSDAVSVNSSLPSTAHSDRSLFPSNNQPKRSLFSSASYSELVASTNSNEGTPNTSILSPHTLPEGIPDHEPKKQASNFKKEPEEEEVAPKRTTRSKASTKDKVTKPGKRPKVSHNMIEKKYRTNINTKIYELRDAVPTLKIAAGKQNVLLSDLEGLAPAAKLNKASVLTKATEYIKHLEKKNENMLSQIAQLQQLIGEANANPPNIIPQQGDRQPNQGMQNSFDGQFPGGFGFAPENNYNTTINYDTQLVPPQFAQQPQQESYQPYNSNWMMGGFATVMGASVLSSDNFRGLAAFPFMPAFLTHPSPTALQLFTIFRYGLVFFGIYLMVLPVIDHIRKPRDPKSPVENTWLTWLLVSAGLQVPVPLLPTDKELILSHLVDGCSDPNDWFKDYIVLSSSEVNFETCFLNVLIGAIICSKFPFISRFIAPNLQTRKILLSKLDATNDDKALQKLSQLFKTSDGAAMFTSESLITRIINVTERRNFFADVKEGENSLAYIDVFKHNRKDIYAIVFGWRVLDLLHDLNLSYLDYLTSQNEDEEARKSEKSLKSDLQTIGGLLEDCNDDCLKQYCLSLTSVISPESTPALVKAVKGSIARTMSNVNTYFDGLDLTDTESVVESEMEDENLSDGTETEVSKKESGITDTVKSLKSLLYSLNLVNEEKFIVLATSSILYYLQQDDELENLKQLLRHLKFQSEKLPLSTLSFTCLLRVVCSMLQSGDDKPKVSLSVEESEILELIVKAARGWLNDDRKNKFLNHSFRSDLTDLVMTKGMLLHDL